MATDEQKRLFKRIVVSQGDLQQARECAHHILRLDLHSSTDKKGRSLLKLLTRILRFDLYSTPRENRSLLKCLNTALVISYTRPFSGNKGSADVRKKLPSEYLDALPEEQRHLHEELIEIRNRDQAHSDAGGLDMTVRVSKIGPDPLAIPIGRNTIAPLSRETVQQVIELIDCLQGKLSEEHIRIQATLEEGEF